MVWLPSRVRCVLEPLSAIGIGAWLAYGSWEKAVAHQTEAIIMGSILGFSFCCSVASLTAGLLFGGWYREFPEGLSWSFVQKLEMVPPLLHAALLSHYSRLLGRAASTPVWTAVYLTGLYNSISASHCDPIHCLAVRQLALFHHCAVFLYYVITTPGRNDPALGVPAPSRWLDQVFVCVIQCFAWFINTYFGKGEATRLRDLQVHAQATLQRDVTLALVTNYLPPAVLLHVQERAAVGNASDVIAWKFDPGCVLQSDIVGFTSLGSRVSPEQLCRYATSASLFAVSGTLTCRSLF